MTKFRTRFLSLLGWSLLSAAACTGCVSTQQRLFSAIDAGDETAALALVPEAKQLDAPQIDGNTALHEASLRGQTSVALALLAAGATLETPNREGNTALHLACLEGKSDTAIALIEAGADVDRANSAGMRPLHQAVTAPASDIVEILVAKGADIDAARTDGSTPLHVSVNACQACVNVLIDHHARLDAADRLGATPLLRAAALGSSWDFRRLSSAGANPLAADLAGNTVLHLAAQSGNAEIAYAGLEVGVPVGALNQAGKSALRLSVAKANGSVTRALLQRWVGESAEEIRKGEEDREQELCAAAKQHAAAARQELERAFRAKRQAEQRSQTQHCVYQADPGSCRMAAALGGLGESMADATLGTTQEQKLEWEVPGPYRASEEANFEAERACSR